MLRPCSSRKIPSWHSSVFQSSLEHYWGRVAVLILTVGVALRPNTLNRVQTICSETHLKEYSPDLLSSQNDREVSPMILQQYGYPNMSWRNTPPINILTWGGVCHRAPPLDKQLSTTKECLVAGMISREEHQDSYSSPSGHHLKCIQVTSNAKQTEKDKKGMSSRGTGQRNIGGVRGRRRKRENHVIIFQFKTIKKNIHKDSLMHFYGGLEKQGMTNIIKYTDE